ncbi:hypothetical protein [Pontibacter mangrovi]|uniref:Uncharacterized protein n=1 Tax=Pontibacter mangrovi TaxID=2589816 RepID=A0A501W809_9BACT|nr:hypothetical protein [Pontibacter mangrovi]TPE44862.1 hypothetical protein FJM65_07525 [Pontibacter mangrovi]
MRNLAYYATITKPSTMNTRKNLQMVLTTLLLVLAVYVINLPENSALDNWLPAARAQAMVTQTEMQPSVSCCLQHALQATEVSGAAAESMVQRRFVEVFSHEPRLLVQYDSMAQLATACK